MAQTRLSSWTLLFLWFGAAVSVAEILAGGLLAELGLARGLTAIVLGHLVGTGLLVLGGLIGFRERLPAVRSTRISFGRQGSYLVSVANVLQLVGWTAVMLVEGGRAVNAVASSLWGLDSPAGATVLLGALVALWVGVGIRGMRVLNTVAVCLLLGLTVVLSAVLLGRPMPEAAPATGSFGMGFELSIIMPLSWFPLMADYTSMARTRAGSWLAPFTGYFVGSCWMYAIGMLGALHTGQADPTGVMLAADLGLAALMVVGLSTVTTTFLDVFSAAESSLNVFERLPRRTTAVAFAAAGTLLALVFPIERYVDFLYLLGSVFAPIIAILLSDYYIRRVDMRAKTVDAVAMVSLASGMTFYHLVKGLDWPMGPTLATIAFTLVAHNILRQVTGGAARQARA